MRLKDYLRLKDLKVPTMAKIIGITPNYLYQIIQGRVTPSYPLRKLIESYCNGEVKAEEWEDKSYRKLNSLTLCDCILEIVGQETFDKILKLYREKQ